MSTETMIGDGGSASIKLPPLTEDQREYLKKVMESQRLPEKWRGVRIGDGGSAI